MHGVKVVFPVCIIPHLSVSHFIWLFIIQPFIARLYYNSVQTAFSFIASNPFISSSIVVPRSFKSFMKMLSYDPYGSYDLNSGRDSCGTSLVIALVQKHCLPIPTFYFLSFNGDLLKQGPSFSGCLGGDKLADLPRVSEHETKCTLSALHRRTQLGQLHGVLLVPYTSQKITMGRESKVYKRLVFNFLNKKG